ncbi:hypothetical protein HHI36_023203 [Cryptolaemus montrouzieri]|uniref:Uncharacterized protein n=1 Tax=Cryptolaemus montrouzieri TaxID=559131 RepID=A0ABD2PGD2_9CUCU
MDKEIQTEDASTNMSIDEIVQQWKLLDKEEHIESLEEEAEATPAAIKEKIYNKLYTRLTEDLTEQFGNQEEESKLKAYVPPSHIRVSKVELQNNHYDILDFVKRKIPSVDVACEELRVRSGEYRSFKITVPVSQVPLGAEKRFLAKESDGKRVNRSNAEFSENSNYT